jgi:hypothetical protein
MGIGRPSCAINGLLYMRQEESLVSNYVQQDAVKTAIEEERSAGRDVAFHPLRTPGKAFAEGLLQYTLVLKRETTEKLLYLNIYPTFETKFKQTEILREYVNRIRQAIQDFWDTSDEELERIVAIS